MSPPSEPPPEGEDLVLTPGGPRPREQVHPVHPGETVRRDEAGNISVVAPQQPASLFEERSVTMPQNLVLTPGGYRHPSLVHRVEPGHAVHFTDGKPRLLNLATKALIDLPEVTVEPDYSPSNGWIADAVWMNTSGNPVSSFHATWRVPPAPKVISGQTIFLFNGMQPSPTNLSATTILHPVLQWGKSWAGGGNYWSVTSWLVLDNGLMFYTPAIQVNIGDTLVGAMTLTGQSGNLYNYSAEFEGIVGTSLPAQNFPMLRQCFITLGVQDLYSCSNYPDTSHTAFQHIDIQTGGTTPALNWTPETQMATRGEHAIVVSNSATDGEVDIYYCPLQLGPKVHPFPLGSTGYRVTGSVRRYHRRRRRRHAAERPDHSHSAWGSREPIVPAGRRRDRASGPRLRCARDGPERHAQRVERGDRSGEPGTDGTSVGGRSAGDQAGAGP